MKFHLGVTDFDWFTFLKARAPEDINYWRLSGRRFAAIEKGEPFLFKLKAPYNAIGGVGFFSAFAAMPLAVAWDFFRERNGVASLRELKAKIEGYRRRQQVAADPTLTIGCIILTDPVFFEQEEWIAQPEDWSASEPGVPSLAQRAYLQGGIAASGIEAEILSGDLRAPERLERGDAQNKRPSAHNLRFCGRRPVKFDARARGLREARACGLREPERVRPAP